MCTHTDDQLIALLVKKGFLDSEAKTKTFNRHFDTGVLKHVFENHLNGLDGYVSREQAHRVLLQLGFEFKKMYPFPKKGTLEHLYFHYKISSKLFKQFTFEFKN